MRVALIGGSFNPIHSDHVSMIKYCYHQLGFDAVWIIPNYHNPDKSVHELASLHHRLKMIEIATSTLKYVHICQLEFAPRAHLTYQTINQLIKTYPNKKFTFCLGQDLLINLEKWDQFGQIKTQVTLICFQRASHISPQEQEILQRNGIKMYRFNNQNLCSTTIRKGGQLMQQISSINNYINYHHLYLIPRLKAAHVQKKRMAHCLQVAITARDLARQNQVNPQHAYLAGALHDITKNWTYHEHLAIIKRYGYERILVYHPNLYHAWSGYLYLKHHLLVTIESVLTAVKNHTTASCSERHPLEKIIFIADKVSRDRTHRDLSLYRQLSQTNLDWCYYQLIKRTLSRIKNQHHINDQDPLWHNFLFWSNKFDKVAFYQRTQNLRLKNATDIIDFAKLIII